MLAVLTSTVGQPSETFVRRHVQALRPGATVVVARTRYRGEHGWSVDAPTLVLDEVGPLPRLGGARMLWTTAGLLRPGRLVPAPQRDALAAFLDRHGVTVVLGEFLDATLPHLPLLRGLGIPVVPHAHGSDVSMRLTRPWWRQAYRQYAVCGAVVVVSHVAKARLAALGLDPARIHVVPCGTPLPPERRTDGPSAPLRCLAVGRLVAKKSPLVTLRAFAEARAAVTTPLTLDLVGDGPLREEVQTFVRAHGLHDAVTLHGALPHERVQELLSQAHVFVQHSVRDPDTGNEEGLPVAVLEGMSHGVPVVATRHGGIPEAITDGETGLLVDEGDVAAMAAALGRLARDPGLRARLGGAGRRRVAEAFCWERERDQLLRILESQEAGRGTA